MDKVKVLKTMENAVLYQYINTLPTGKINFKDLKSHFKGKGRVLGVYFVFNDQDDLIYVGQSGAHKNTNSNWGLADRINQHQTKGDTGAKNFNVSTQKVKNSYKFSYIDLSDHQKEIKELEKFFIGIFSRKLRFNSYHKIKIFS